MFAFLCVCMSVHEQSWKSVPFVNNLGCIYVCSWTIWNITNLQNVHEWVLKIMFIEILNKFSMKNEKNVKTSIFRGGNTLSILISPQICWYFQIFFSKIFEIFQICFKNFNIFSDFQIEKKLWDFQISDFFHNFEIFRFIYLSEISDFSAK